MEDRGATASPSTWEQWLVEKSIVWQSTMKSSSSPTLFLPSFFFFVFVLRFSRQDNPTGLSAGRKWVNFLWFSPQDKKISSAEQTKWKYQRKHCSKRKLLPNCYFIGNEGNDLKNLPRLTASEKVKDYYQSVLGICVRADMKIGVISNSRRSLDCLHFSFTGSPLATNWCQLSSTLARPIRSKTRQQCRLQRKHLRKETV